MRTGPRWAAILLAPALAATVPAAALAQAAGASGAAAQWTEQELDFTAMEFTVHYSCDGLHAKLGSVLRVLGARPGAELSAIGCMEPGFPGSHMPVVKMRFASLRPGAGSERGGWKSIDLVGPGRFDDTECELMQEVSRQLLPRFAVRNVQGLPACFPHSQTRVPSFRLEVFAPADPQDSRK